MASIQKRNRNGKVSYLVQFMYNKQRKSISLSSDFKDKYVKTFANVIDQLVSSNETGVNPPRQVISWIRDAPQCIRDKLSNVNLLEVEIDYTYKELFDMYIQQNKQSLSPQTIRAKNIFFTNAAKYFNVDTRLSQMTSKFIKEICFKINSNESWSTATKAGIIKFIKVLLNWAVKNEIIEKSPAINVQVPSFKNKENEYFVSLEEYYALIGATQNVELRLALALYRIGGLRRSEIFNISWSDVHSDRIQVYSTKTKRTRAIPLFSEIKDKLNELPNRSGRLFIRYSNPGSVSHELYKIRKRAGIKEYPRLIQNLRSSRANEVYRTYGAIAEQNWIGHTPSVAFDHYLHCTDEEYERATQEKFGCKNVCENT